MFTSFCWLLPFVSLLWSFLNLLTPLLMFLTFCDLTPAPKTPFVWTILMLWLLCWCAMYTDAQKSAFDKFVLKGTCEDLTSATSHSNVCGFFSLFIFQWPRELPIDIQQWFCVQIHCYSFTLQAIYLTCGFNLQLLTLQKNKQTFHHQALQYYVEPCAIVTSSIVRFRFGILIKSCKSLQKRLSVFPFGFTWCVLI